jgi:glycosyltransferase involved in cell wall biosynthesis
MSNYCFFNSVKAWGGGEKWHLEVATYLHNKGQKVLLIAAPNSPLAEKAKTKGINVQTIKLSNVSFLNPFILLRIARLLNGFKIESLIMNSPRDLKCAGLASKLINSPKIIFRRGSDIPIQDSALNRFLYQRVVDKVLVNSEATKRSLNKNNSQMVPVQKIELVPNGIDTNQFLEGQVSKVYEKQKDEFVLCTLGRLVPQKNHNFLIDVAVALKKRELKFKLIIGGSGKLETALRDTAKQKGILSEVVFAGFIEKPKDLYLSGDVFLLSSLWEGFGYVLAEAGLCELPTVAFNVSSNAQIIQEGKTGFLIEEGAVDLFAEAIIRLAKNDDLKNKMGKRAKRFVADNFEAKNIFEKVEAVIRPD